MPEESVAAIVRLRPKVSSAPLLDIQCDQKSISISRSGCSEQRSYSFTAVYGSDTDHGCLYSEQLSALVAQPLDGINATVFAYGHTGAGKTHTMLGTARDPGMIPRSVKALLSAAAHHTTSCGSTVQVAVSYLEVYNEKVFDLLAPRGSKPTDLPIRQDRQYNISVPGLREVPVTSFQSFQSVFGPASEKRTTASTKLNSESSRSHAVLMLKVKHQHRDGRQLVGKLHLIDLAGSENAKRAGNVGDRLKESGAINTSLFALSKVVSALTGAKGSSHVPYRDSKLTRLLQDSLGGSARSLVIANIAPEESHLVDTLSTLQFATKSMQIINKPVPTVSIAAVQQIAVAATPAALAPAITGPTVAPSMDVLPSPFVRHTKAMLSNEVRGINDMLREERRRDQREMKSVLTCLTETVALLASQQAPAARNAAARPGAVGPSSVSTDLHRRQLHSPARADDAGGFFDEAGFADARATVTSGDHVPAPPSLRAADDAASSCLSQASEASERPVQRDAQTFVVDRNRGSAPVPFSELSEPSAACASPLLPGYRLPRRSTATATAAQHTAVPRNAASSSSSTAGAGNRAETSSSLDTARPPSLGPRRALGSCSSPEEASVATSPAPRRPLPRWESEAAAAANRSCPEPAARASESRVRPPEQQWNVVAGDEESTHAGAAIASSSSSQPARGRGPVGGSRLGDAHRHTRLRGGSVAMAADVGNECQPPPPLLKQLSDPVETKRVERRTSKRKSVAPSSAVVWENDVDMPCAAPLSSSSSSALGAARAKASEQKVVVADDFQPQKKRKRLISRKAIARNVIDQSPAPQRRVPLSSFNPNTHRPSLATTATLADKNCLESNTIANSCTGAGMATDSTPLVPSAMSLSVSRVAPSRPVATPVAKVAPIPVSDTPDLFDSCDPLPLLSPPPDDAGAVPSAAQDKPDKAVKKESGCGSWTPEEDKAFTEALALYPLGQRFVLVTTDDGLTKRVGRNILIAAYVTKKTGKDRTAQQVGRRCRVMAQRKEKDAGATPQTVAELQARILFLEKIAVETEKDFKFRVKELVEEYTSALGQPLASS